MARHSAGSLNYGGRCSRVYRCQLFLDRVVVEVAAKSEILPSKYTRQGRKRVRGHDAGPGRAIKRNVSGGRYQLHASDFSIFSNSEFDDRVPVSLLSGFWNRFVPILPYVVSHPVDVRAEIDALSVADNLDGADLAALGSSSQAKIATANTLGGLGTSVPSCDQARVYLFPCSLRRERFSNSFEPRILSPERRSLQNSLHGARSARLSDGGSPV